MVVVRVKNFDPCKRPTVLYNVCKEKINYLNIIISNNTNKYSNYYDYYYM